MKKQLRLRKFYYPTYRSGVVFSFCLLFLIGRELIQINTSAVKLHFRQFENLLDLSEIILLSLTILSELYEWAPISILKKVVITTIGVAWLELLFLIGHCNYGVSVFTSAVIQVSLVVEYFVFNFQFISHCCHLFKIIVELLPFGLTALLMISAF